MTISWSAEIRFLTGDIIKKDTYIAHDSIFLNMPFLIKSPQSPQYASIITIHVNALLPGFTGVPPALHRGHASGEKVGTSRVKRDL